MKMKQSDWPVAKAYPVRIEPGKYRAFCYDYQMGCSFKFRRDIYLKFRILDGAHEGTELYMACTFPKGHMSPRHKYYKQWSIVNGAVPSNGNPLRPDIFLKKHFSVLVRDTNIRHANGEPAPECLRYSVVDTILGRFTG